MEETTGGQRILESYDKGQPRHLSMCCASLMYLVFGVAKSPLRPFGRTNGLSMLKEDQPMFHPTYQLVMVGYWENSGLIP